MHKAVSQYISELERHKHPILKTDNQVLCGGSVLTVSPNIEADDIDSIRLDMPNQFQSVSEAATWLLFFVAVVGSEKFCEIQPRIKMAMHGHGEFNELVDGWQIRLFWESDHAVLLAEAMYQA
jgi:hypothetical protein